MIKLGLYLATQFRPETDPRQILADVVEQTKLAKACGYHSLWAAQHFVTAPLQMLATTPLLAYLMPHAEGMQVGPNILLLAMLPPVHLAEEAVTLDLLSGGKYIFGIGLGYRDAEFHAMGTKKKGSAKRYEEAITICRRLWTEDRITYSSENFSLDDVGIGMKPLQPGGPPIWIAAVVDAAIRRAAEMGDAWLITFYPTVASLVPQMKLYRDALTAAGKPTPTDFPVLRECYVGRNHATALSECRDALSYKYKAYASWGQDKILSDADRFDQPFDDFLKDRFFIGDRAYTRDELQRYKDTLGVDHFMMRMQWPGLSQKQVLHSIEALAEAARDVK